MIDVYYFLSMKTIITAKVVGTNVVVEIEVVMLANIERRVVGGEVHFTLELLMR